MKTLLLIPFFLFLSFRGLGQNNFCSTLMPDTMIGKEIKFDNDLKFYFHDNFYQSYGIVDTSIIRMLEYTRAKGYIIPEGTKGIVTFVTNGYFSFYNDGSGDLNERIYLIKINDILFPASCKNVISPDEPSLNERKSKVERITAPMDSCIGCIDLWGEIGLASMKFTCNLLKKEIDTLLVTWQFGRGYANHNPGVIILWFKNSRGYMKTYLQDGSILGYKEFPVMYLDWSPLLKVFSQKESRSFIVDIGSHGSTYYEYSMKWEDGWICGRSLYDFYDKCESVKYKLGRSKGEDIFYYIHHIYKLVRTYYK